jgi:hypothetical protein
MTGTVFVQFCEVFEILETGIRQLREWMGARFAKGAMADRNILLALNAQLMSKLMASNATDDDLKTLKAVMGLLERSVLVRSPSFCVRMADRETLIALNAQLMSKLKVGNATDDDLNTLKAVMHLLEQDAAKDVEKRSISSSVPQTAAKRQVRMASQLVKASHDICSEGQEWYGRRTIERMRAEADAEDSTAVKCVVGSSAGSMVKAEADSNHNQASQDQEATKRIDSAHRALEARKAIEAAQRLGAAERAMAAREKEHSATFQRQREEERRREDEAARRAEDRRRQDEARRAREERERKEEVQRRADRRREEDASRRLDEDRRQAQHDVQLLGGFAKGDSVGSRITYLQNRVTIVKGDIGTVIGACTVDVPDKHRRVSVDFGRYGNGICNMLVSPDSEAQIYKVPTAMPATKSSLLSVSDPHSTRGTPSTPTTSSSANGSKTTPPRQRPSTAAPAKDGPRSEDTSRPNSASVRTVDDGTAASVHRVSHCDRCGARFTDRKSL